MEIQDLRAFHLLWNCAVCLKPAKSGAVLEFQFLEFDTNVYFDIDIGETPWIKCFCCQHTYHLSCYTSVPPEMFNLFGPFDCCHQ